MATYKVLQDIEAEDKFLGPLTLKQFIFSAICFVSIYISIIFLTKNIWWLALPLLPIIFASGFLAFPWGRDQPTEIWLLARFRFLVMPRRRIWDQTGMQELVSITVPKKIEAFLGNNISQTEVKSRLKALASTIDSRGWAVKDANVSIYSNPISGHISASPDRLVDMSSLPQAVSNVDVQASDDIWDEQNNSVASHFNQMINTSSKTHRQATLDHMQQARDGKTASSPKSSTQPNPAQNYWFMDQPDTKQVPQGYATFDAQNTSSADDTASIPAPVATTADEQALLDQLHAQADQPPSKYGNTKVISPLSTGRNSRQSSVASHRSPSSSSQATGDKRQATSPSTPDPAIMLLANNDDLSVATIARQANKKHGQEPDKGEVVVPLR